MNEQHREIQVWLEKLYGGQDVPSYEVTPRSLELLAELKGQNEQMERQGSIILEDLQQKTEEYHVEADRITGILKQLGLGPEALSQSGSISLQTITRLATLLELKDTSDTSLLLGWTALSERKLRLSESQRSEERLTQNLLEKTKTALMKSNELHKVLEGLEQQAIKQAPAQADKVKNSRFLEKKAEHYRNQVRKLQVELNQTGMDRSLFHRKLVKRADELEQLKKKLQPMRAKLDSYQDLPPDVSLAKVKVEEAKAELAVIEAELTKHMDLMYIQ